MLFLVLNLVCSLLALAVQKVLLPMVPALHGGKGLIIGDSLLFHEAAWYVAQNIRSGGWQEWALYPGGFTGNVGLLSALYVFFGPEPAVFIPFNVAAHVTGALMLYRIGPLLVSGKAGALGGLVAATLFACFPSSLLWYSQNHKDSFAIAGTLILLYFWLRLQKRQIFSPGKALWFLLAILGGICLVIAARPYLIVIVTIGFLASYLCCFVGQCLKTRALPSWKMELLQVAFLALVFLGAFQAKDLGSSRLAFGDSFAMIPEREGEYESIDASDEWKWKRSGRIHPMIDALFERASVLRVNYLSFNKLVQAGSEIDPRQKPSSITESLTYLPRALLVGCFAPFPESWAKQVSIPQLAVAAETFVWYFGFPGILYLIYKYPSRRLFAALVFSLLLITMYSYTTPNVGTLYRVRYGFWLVLLLCGSLGWASVGFGLLSRMTEHSGDSPNHKAEVDSTGVGASSNLGAVAAAGMVTLLITLSGFFGFLVRDLLLIHSAGMTEGLDLFFVAMMFPMLFVTSLALPMGDIVTRPFVQAVQDQNIEEASGVLRRFLGMALIILGASSAFVALFANLLVRVVIGDGSPESIDTAAFYLRLFSPVVVLSVWTVIGNCALSGLSQSRNAALAGLVVPFFAICSIILIESQPLFLSAILGMLSGTVANVLIVMILCWRNGVSLVPLFSPGRIVYAEIKPYVWMVSAAVIAAIAIPMNFAFAGSLGPGALASWAFANKITVLLTSIFSVSVTAVVLPFLARKLHYAPSDSSRNQLYFMVIAGTWVGIFLATGVSVFAEPLVSAVFSSENFDESHIVGLTNVICIGAMQIPIVICGAILLKSVAVSGASSTMLLALLFGLGANLAANYIAVPKIGIGGVAMGAYLFVMVSTFSLALTLRKKVGISFRLPLILLVGWISCGLFIYEIGERNFHGLLVAAVNLVFLGGLHFYSLRYGLHHRRSVNLGERGNGR